MGSLLNNRFTRPLFNPGMRLLTRRRSTRRLVNALQNRLSFEASEQFFWSFSRAYRDADPASFEEGAWVVEFPETTVKVMLVREGLGERWDIALSLRGHDSAVKETYANILGSDLRPDVFVDVGANYGTHSLLFARSNVRAIAFEPNAECAGLARELQALNGVAVEWHQVAIGNSRDEVVLNYPAGGHWLGRIGAQPAGAPAESMRSAAVAQRRLDDYDFEPGRMMIKIDVEGYEADVLRGAGATLFAYRPLVVFESVPELGAREPLWDLLDGAGYAISGLPWRPRARHPVLDCSSFAAAGGTNFIAVPKEAP